VVTVSLCVPTRNRPDSVLPLVERLLAVDVPGAVIEVLVGDNSDDERTGRALAGLAGVAYLRNRRNLGQFGNCNALIARARGDWVHIVHDDDMVEPGYLERLVPLLDDRDAVLVTGRTRFVGQAATVVQERHDARHARMGFAFPARLDGPTLLGRCMEHGCPFVFSHTLFRRETAIALGGFDERLTYMGDYDLWLRMLRAGAVLTADADVGDYQLHPENLLAAPRAARGHHVEHIILTLRTLLEAEPLLAGQGRSAALERVRTGLPRAAVFAHRLLDDPVLAGTLLELVRRADDAELVDGRGSYELLRRTPRWALRLVATGRERLRPRAAS
jgi:glycosyltransferase involved in cell wall biosynthesis